jgi:predicted choloylglycine hydrolase
VPTWRLTFHLLAEDVFGDAWAATFRRLEPGYRAWLDRHGGSWPALEESRYALATHMPELLPHWERLMRLAGGGDDVARMLALWRPPSILTGCSQAVVTKPRALVRNYDYDPRRFDAVVACTALTGRHVLGVSDCLWGLLDGVNDAGLVASLTFGGRNAVGPGFAAPLVLRYVLETCTTSLQAREVLRRLPVHMPYNFTVDDLNGDAFTAWVGPDRPAQIVATQAATNHQGPMIEWLDYAVATGTLRRLEVLRALQRLAIPLERAVDRFLEPPLYAVDYTGGFGTLYTAVYRSPGRSLTLVWPDSQWQHRIGALGPVEHTVMLESPPPGISALR